ALFPLGLGLGFLAYRTQSLVGPLVLHSAFNGISCLALLFIVLASSENHSEKGSAVTSAVRRSSPLTTSSEVPGVSLPRRMNARAMVDPKRGEAAEEVTRPTSLSSRTTRAPCETGPAPVRRRPWNDQLTWPRSRLRTIGSCP